MHIEIQNYLSRPPTGASPLDSTGGLLSPRPPAQDVPPHFAPGLRPCRGKETMSNEQQFAGMGRRLMKSTTVHGTALCAIQTVI